MRAPDPGLCLDSPSLVATGVPFLGVQLLVCHQPRASPYGLSGVLCTAPGTHTPMHKHPPPEPPKRYARALLLPHPRDGDGDRFLLGGRFFYQHNVSAPLITAWAFIGLSDHSAMGHAKFKSKPSLLQHGFSRPFQELVG